MKLLDLELENWSVHSYLEVPLANGLQIEGRNGTGKSSILEAIRFIFARDARKYKRRIKHGTRGCTVKLRFLKDGDEYLVEKKLHLKRQSTAKILMDSRVIADSPMSAYKILQDILPENIFDKLVYVPQGALIELIDDLGLKGGREKLDSLLGLDKFENVDKGIKQELSEIRGKLDILEKEIMKYPNNADREFKDVLDRLKREVKEINAKRDKMKKEWGRLETKLENIESRVRRMEIMAKTRDELKDKVNRLESAIIEKRSELRSVQENLQSIEEKAKSIEKLRVREKKLKNYPKVRKLLSDLRMNEEKLKEVADVEREQNELTRILDSIRRIPDLEREKSRLEEIIDELKEKLAVDKKTIDRLEEYLRGLDGLDEGARCPRCGQRITGKHIAMEQENAISKIESTKKRIAMNSKSMEKFLSMLEKNVEELEKLRGEKVRSNELKENVDKKLKYRSEIEQRIGKLKSELYSVGYRNESEKIIDEYVNELNSIGGRIDVFSEEIKKRPQYLKIQTEIEKFLSEKTGELKIFHDKLGKIEMEYDECLLDGLRAEYNRIQREIYEIQNRINKYNMKIENNKKEVIETKSKLENFLEIKNQIKEMGGEMNLLIEARRLFPEIVKYLREKFIAQLSSQLTYYFKRINQNPKYRDISFNKEYEIKINSTEGEFRIYQLSGGEKAQLAVAFRIALIRLLSPIKLLILDEPFGNLDKEHREILGDALNKIAMDGQLILVTHVAVDSLNLAEKLDLGGY